MYSNPDRVRGPCRALRKSSGSDHVPRTANHARSAMAVSFPQWQNPFTPALPSDMYRTVWIQGKLIEPNADQLRNAQTGGKGEVKHRPIPDTVRSLRIGRIQHCLHFVV